MNRALVCCLALVSSAGAQLQVTIPSPYHAVDAPSATWLAGIGAAARQQILISSAHLSPLEGRALTALRFRRDYGFAEALPGGSAPITVRLAHLARPPHQALPDFAANATTPIEVFRGTLSVPAAPASATFLGWQTPHVVEISFSTPFLYTGGGLAIDVEAAGPTTPFLWPIDAVRDSTAGAISSVGTPCGPYASTGPTSAARAEDLIPGSTARFWFRHEPGSVALMALGTSTLLTPLDLSPFGFAGCALWLDPLVQLPLPVTTNEVAPGFGGVAAVSVELPLDATFLAAHFAVQWVGIDTTLVTSNALDCHVSLSVPPLGIAIVEREPLDPAAQVFLTTAPILQFDAQ